MSLNIDQIVIHQLRKQSDDNLQMVLRNSLLQPTEAVSRMLEDLHGIYSTRNKAYGIFAEESELAGSLRLCRQGQQDFLAFSRSATGRLRDELAKYPFAADGVVLFAHYRYLAVEYLMVAVLDSQSSSRVNDALDIDATQYLDINQSDIVARVDLTEWETQPESQRYLSFLKGRVGRKVADFFMDFLGALAGLDTKAQNLSLLQAVNDYCQQSEIDKQQRQQYREQVYSFCTQQLQAGEEITIAELSTELPPIAGQSFAQFSSEQGYQLEESFPADRGTLRQLTRFSGSGGGVTINFEAALLGERIFWDAATDTLTIKGLPPNLRDQLQRREGKS